MMPRAANTTWDYSSTRSATNLTESNPALSWASVFFNYALSAESMLNAISPPSSTADYSSYFKKPDSRNLEVIEDPESCQQISTKTKSNLSEL